MPDRVVILFNGQRARVPESWSNDRVIEELTAFEDEIKRKIQDQVSGTSSFDASLASMQGNRLRRSPLRRIPETVAKQERQDETSILRPVEGGGSADYSVLSGGTPHDRAAKAALRQIVTTGARVASMIPSRDPEAQQTLRQFADANRAQGPTEEAGAFAGDVATGALPFATAGKVAGLASKAPFLVRAPLNLGVNAATGGAVAGAQGHDPTIGAITGAVMPILTGAATGLVNRGVGLASRVLKSTGPALNMLGRISPTALREAQQRIARTALEERALPGVFRKFDRRVTQRIDEAARTAEALALDAPEYADALIRKPFDQKSGFQTPATTEQTALLSDQGLPIKPVRKVTGTIWGQSTVAKKPILPNAIRVGNELRKAAVKAPAVDVTARGQRAAAMDLFDEASRAGLGRDNVPTPGTLGVQRGQQIAAQLDKVKNLMPVNEADAIRIIDEGGVPGIGNRIGVSVMNRLVAPSAQGMFSAGRAGEIVTGHPAIRAAMAAVINRTLGRREPGAAPDAAAMPAGVGGPDMPTAAPAPTPAPPPSAPSAPTTPPPPQAQAMDQVLGAAAAARPSRLSITQPDPARFADKVARVRARMAELGHPVTVVQSGGGRNAKDQAALYAQGRTTPGPIVTDLDGTTNPSTHQQGTGTDLVFVVNGQPSWDDTLPWDVLGKVAKEEGLSWGGDWKQPVDRPHVQLYPARPKFGFTPGLAERGVPPGGYGP